MGISVTLATLQSYNHIIDDIERGIKIYNKGSVEILEIEPTNYIAKVPHKGNDTKTVSVTFSRDGQTLEHHHCDCTWKYENPPVCRHVVAAVLAIQGGIAETKITLEKTESAKLVVTEKETARVVGSGSADVFATPMMIILMEKAAYLCLADCLDVGQTSVGTNINVSHTAASPIGAKITATATINSVAGRKIEFTVTASDECGEIGTGSHTRIIVDDGKFIAKAKERGLKYGI